jgi:acylphosphatase
MPSYRLEFRGRVQGVGFRWRFQTHAEKAGMKGIIWNRSDGAVEAFVETDDVLKLTELCYLMREGPGHIDSLTMNEHPMPRDFDRFEIGPSQ